MTRRHPDTALLDHRLDRLGELVDRMMRAMHRLTRAEAPTTDLTPHQCMLLRELDACGTKTLGALRATAQGAQSTLSEMVGRLARAGYVHKRPDPEDGRAVLVEITPRGREELVATRREIRRRHAQILAALGPEDQQAFLAAFETVVALTDRAAATESEEGDDHA